MNKDGWGTDGKDIVARRGLSADYGHTPGQLAAMVSSPPYADSVNQSDQANDAGARIERKGAAGIDTDKSVNVGGPNSVLNREQVYGKEEGQLGAMKDGGLYATVSSPPYRTGGHHNGVFDTWGGEIGETDTPAWSRLAKKDTGYGQSHGQMEQMGQEGDFWTAARTIVDQCYLVLKDGAIAVWVVKRFVRDKQIVDFPDQWRMMCEAAGFETVEWIRAWFIEDCGTQIDMFGNHVERKIERKSFFRRLYESKYPENSIDWEDILIMRKEGE